MSRIHLALLLLLPFFLIASGFMKVADADVLTVAGCAGCSDVRIKKEIRPLERSLEKIEKLNGVNFKWRKPEERQIAKKLVLPTDKLQTGLIAQDVERIFPELVTENKAEGVKTINYNGLIAPIVEAVKELAAKFIALESKVTVISGRMTELLSSQGKILIRLASYDNALKSMEEENAFLKAEIARKDKIIETRLKLLEKTAAHKTKPAALKAQ